MNVDSDLQHHRDTWNAFVKGSIWLGGISAAILVLMAIFVV